MRLFLFGLLTLAACDSDTTDTDIDTDTSADTSADTDTTADTDIDTDTLGETDGVQSSIDASSSAQWVYYDLETLSVTTPSDPTDSTEWDLAFQQFSVIVNGGVNGTGGVQALVLDGQHGDFGSNGDDVPQTGWTTDETDATVFNGWYNYDGATHVISPADKLFYIQTVEGATFELRIVDYYDADENPHLYTLETALRDSE
jgi:hypothetical protein